MNHQLKATCQTVHLGGFSPNLEPAIIVESGHLIDLETYTGYYVAGEAPPEFLPPELLEICHHLPPERKTGAGPHLLTGPIYVKDAEPGDVLEIKLHKIYPSLPIGFNAIRRGWGALPAQFSEPKLRFIPLDLTQNIASLPLQTSLKNHSQKIAIPLHPFFGILGVATEEINRSSVPPGAYGGNLDNRELQAESRLFLPIFVPGALFSIGDGHAAQGDGEIDVTAIETSMNGTIQLTVRKDFKLTLPIAETPTHLMTMGFGQTLDEAFEVALKQLLNVLETFTGMNSEDAYVLCSIAANFRITQVVNSPQKGVHALLSKSLLPQPILPR